MSADPDLIRRQYSNRDKTNLPGLLYVIAILTSAAYALHSRLMRRRRVRVSDYNKQLMAIAEDARATHSSPDLYALRDRLVSMLQHIVRDLDRNQVSQEEFEHFSFTWQAVDTVVRDRLAMAQANVSTDATQASGKQV